MFNFARTDTESKSSKGSMCGSMTVPAHYSGSWKSEALLWTYDMYDALALIAQTEVSEAERLDVIFQSEALCTRVCLLNELSNILEILAGCGGNIL